MASLYVEADPCTSALVNYMDCRGLGVTLQRKPVVPVPLEGPDRPA